jgi:4-oxalomesaconate hydratase
MTNERLLVFSAHAADFCSRAGGTLAKYSRYGASVKVVDLTFGERGESDFLWRREGDRITVEEAKGRRRAEVLEAAKVLGVDVSFMDFDDYPLVVDKGRILSIVEEIRSFRPDIVLTHWPNDPTNPDHGTAAKLVLDACACAQATGLKTRSESCPYPKIFFFEPTVPTTEITGFKPTIYIDITDVFEIKMDALRKFESQPFLCEYYTLYARRRGFEASFILKDVKYAEAFAALYPTVSHTLL